MIQTVQTDKINHWQSKINRAGIFVGAMVLVLSHLVMVAIMTMTPDPYAKSWIWTGQSLEW